MKRIIDVIKVILVSLGCVHVKAESHVAEAVNSEDVEAGCQENVGHNANVGNVSIQTLEQDAEIEIFGHRFNGLADIKAAVEVSAEIEYNHILKERWMQRLTPSKPVDGIHVLELYESYPCFDSSDYDYENRSYSNFFFSREPFSDADIDRLAEMEHESNACLVFSGMDPEVVPAVYFEGSSWHKLIVALPKESH